MGEKRENNVREREREKVSVMARVRVRKKQEKREFSIFFFKKKFGIHYG